MAAAVATIAPMPHSPNAEPGPSSPPTSSRQPHPPPAAAKSFKRLFRTSLQETIRHVSSNSRKDKGKEPEAKGRSSTDAATPPSAFMDYLQRPSIFRRSAESQNKETSPVSEDGRKSATPSVSSTGGERQRRVLRKSSRMPAQPQSQTQTQTQTPESSTNHVSSRHRSSVPPPSKHPSSQEPGIRPSQSPPSPDADNGEHDSIPGWGAFIPPTLSKGSMSSPALHALRDDDDPLPHPNHHHHNTKSRSPLSSLSAFVHIPSRMRKPSLVLPPKSTVTPTPVHAAAASSRINPPRKSSFEAPTKSSKSKMASASVAPAPISRPTKLMPTSAVSAPSPPPRSPSRLVAQQQQQQQNGSASASTSNGNANGLLNGRASSPQLNNGNGTPAPPSPSSKGSRLIGKGHPSTSRRLPGASASTSHLPLPSPSTLLNASSPNLAAPAEEGLPPPPPSPTVGLGSKSSVDATRQKRTSVDSKRTGTGAGASAGTSASTGAAETPQQPQRRPSMDVSRPSMESTTPTPTRRASIDVVGRKEREKEREKVKKPSVDAGAATSKEGRPPSRTSNSGSSSGATTTTQRAASPSVTSSSQPQAPRRRTSSPVALSPPSSPVPSRPGRLGRGIGSVSTSNLPLAESASRSASPITPSNPTRVMPRRASHGHTNSVPVAFPVRDKDRPESPAATASSRAGTPTRTHRAKTASLDAAASHILSPQREAVRKAGSVLVRELVHKRSGFLSAKEKEKEKEVGEELDRRLGGLLRLLKAGSANEEREKRYFGEAVKDGYALCQYINKLRPGSVSRVDAGSSSSAVSSNVTKFLHAAEAYGVPNEELFDKADLVSPSSLSLDNLANVAQTVLALARLAESPPPRKFPSGSLYQSGGSSVSTPNLLRPTSPSTPTQKKQKRFPPPVPALPTVRSASPTDPAPPSSSSQAHLLDSESALDEDDEEEDPFLEGSVDTHSNAPSAYPPITRPAVRISTTSRTSVASSDVTTAYSSLLDHRSTRFGTMRTMTTEATSIVPGSETPSLTPTEASAMSKAVVSLFGGDYLDSPSPGALERMNSRARRMSLKNGGPSSPVEESYGGGGSPTTGGMVRRRDRRVSEEFGVDLTRVAEEGEEGTVPRSMARYHQNQQQQAQSPPATKINLRQGKWPDDFMEAFKYPDPSGENGKRKKQVPTPIRIPSTEEVSLDSPTGTPTSQQLDALQGMQGQGRHSPAGLVRSKTRVRRTSELSPVPSDGLDPITPTPVRVRRRSSRQNSDVLLPKDALLPKDREPSPPHGEGSPTPSRVSPRRTVSNRYVPRPKSDEPNAGVVPFPRSLSGEVVPRTSSSSETVREDSNAANGSAIAEGAPSAALSPFQGRTKLEKERRSSFGDQQALRASSPLPGRKRHESMMNMGSNERGKNKAESSLIGGMDGSAVRKTLIVKEEGKPPTHYQLGNCIGRGQFGSVYRALNLNTGQTVAVKRIRLEGLSETEIKQLMHEVEIVKRLSHPSIVKYEGMARDSDTLSIVLEYAENGSLAQTLKAFGKLNESLVASYVAKVLEGLHYLHSSDVVHCDLKAANILTTKTGNVKLSDFGVSLNLRAMEQIKNDVAGTPNWMAPEVIELKGASPASDIWSLACTIIELLTGAPPYADVQNSMSVMFRIVEDPNPPIPEGLSEPLQDFLTSCFNKDPAERPDAVTLFEHPWLKNEWGVFKELRPQDSIPFLRRVSAEVQRSDIRNLSFVDDDHRPGSPRSIASLANAAAEGPPRPHEFVKSAFSQAVTCRVCNLPVKKSAMFCKECSLIAHSKCVADAPQECDDLRTRVLRLSLDLQREHALRQGSPSPLARTPPLSRQASPGPAARQPMPTSPLASPLSGSPPTQSAMPSSDKFRLFGKKKSKASSLATAASRESLRPKERDAPPVSYKNTEYKHDETARPNTIKRLSRARSSEGHFMTLSRHSIRSGESTSEETTDSHRNRRSAVEPSTVESEVDGTRNSRISFSGEILMAADAGEEAYRKRRGSRRESNRDSRDSDASKCTVQ